MDFGTRMYETAVELWGSERPLAELSERTGYSITMLSKIKNGGTHDPRNRHMLEIAQTLGVEPWWLVTGRGPKWRGDSGLSAEDQEWLLVGRSATAEQRQAARALLDRNPKRRDSKGSNRA